jgi:hypothetical protein
MAMFEYNPTNLKLVSDTIVKHLNSDLLPKKWVERNKKNPMFGHCHTASACLQKLFGTKNIKLYRALDDEGIWHWWAVDAKGTIIDLTVDQYHSEGRTPPWKNGEKAATLGFDYRKRVMKLLDKVTNELSSNGTPPQ